MRPLPGEPTEKHEQTVKKTGMKVKSILTALLLVRPVLALDVQDKLMTNGFQQGRIAGDPIDTVVVHFSSNVVADKKNPHNVDAVIKVFSSYGVSAHYLIDRAGTIYRLVKESDTSYHAGKGEWHGRTDTLNRFSIGIELLGIGTYDEMAKTLNISKSDYDSIPKEHLGFTEAQYTSLKALLSDIESRNAKILNDRQHIIGHSEYAPGRKFDPGTLFQWSKIGF